MIYSDDKLTFRVLSAGVFKHNNGFFDVKARSQAALSYRSKGSAVFKINDETFDVGEGDIIFIPDGVPYQVRYRDSESIVIHLDCCSYRHVDKIVPNNKSELFTAFERICHCSGGTVSQNRLKSLVFSLLSAIEEDAAIKAPDNELAKCIDYIHKSFKDPTLTVEHVCHNNYLSHSTLQRAFLKRFGIPPKEYIIRLKLKYAVELLLSGKMTCREAAYLAGFKDEKYFSRVFKKHYSVPPSKFLGERE